MSKQLIIRDEVHGDISLEGFLRAVVDHPDFQRLRYIKQLGLAEYVFPCATHTRFQHSLGAAYLAKQYFDSLLQTWSEWDFDFDGTVGPTQFKASLTRECLSEVSLHPNSRLFWGRVATLAGLLHDVGHGPWSHTFEYLDLPQDFGEPSEALEGSLGAYFAHLRRNGRRLMHEDISLLYISKILGDLERHGLDGARALILPVSVLVNKKLLSEPHAVVVETELQQALLASGLGGGMSVLRLLAPLISGPFDVDRADYIQRDGRNCGVPIGAVEWRRIVRKVMPCLAHHTPKAGEPSDVVLVSHFKNQHVLDDFIFSLFQMYTQVYLHPKIVAFEEQIRRELDRCLGQAQRPSMDLELHASLSDEGFRIWLEKEFKAQGIRRTLFRNRDCRFQVVGLPVGRGKKAGLEKAGYHLVETQDRPMLKDSVAVYLFSPPGPPDEGKGGIPVVLPWQEASPIANHFHSINHSIEIWIRDHR